MHTTPSFPHSSARPSPTIGATERPPVGSVAPLLSLATAFALPIVREMLEMEHALATLILSSADYSTVRSHADELALHVAAVAIGFSVTAGDLMEACVSQIERTR